MMFYSTCSGSMAHLQEADGRRCPDGPKKIPGSGIHLMRTSEITRSQYGLGMASTPMLMASTIR